MYFKTNSIQKCINALPYSIVDGYDNQYCTEKKKLTSKEESWSEKTERDNTYVKLASKYNFSVPKKVEGIFLKH